jgi:hypothetical protein
MKNRINNYDMRHQEQDLLTDHLKVLDQVDPLPLDPAFYGRLKERMRRRAAKQERNVLRQAGLATVILALLLVVNLRMLSRTSSGDGSTEATGISGFASFYGQSISPDL